jgi:hypothetical protein
MNDPEREGSQDMEAEIASLKAELFSLKTLLRLLQKSRPEPWPTEIKRPETGPSEGKSAARFAVTLLEYDRDKENPEKRIYNPKVLVDQPFGVVERMDVRWHYHELHSAVYTGADVVMIATPGTYSVFLLGPGETSANATRPPQRAVKGPNGELIYEAERLSVRFDVYLTTVSAEKLIIRGETLTFYGRKIIVSFRAQISSWSARN